MRGSGAQGALGKLIGHPELNPLGFQRLRRAQLAFESAASKSATT
jgi:hypothetical protein